MNKIENTNKHSYYGIYAGICAAGGSIFGKLLGFTGELTIYTVSFLIQSPLLLLWHLTTVSSHFTNIWGY